MFTRRSHLPVSALATALASVVLAAIPVTFTFAQSYSQYGMYDGGYSGMNNYGYSGMYATPQYGQAQQYGYPYGGTYGQSYRQPQRMLYWCNGYYSYSPCPVYYTPPMYSMYSYSYPSYSYSYGYSYNSYNYNYNYSYGDDWWW